MQDRYWSRAIGVTVLIVSIIISGGTALAQGKLGLGGTYWYKGLTLEGFGEISLWNIAAVRFSGGIFAGGDYSGFLAGGALLLTLGERFQAYGGIEGILTMFLLPPEEEGSTLFARDWLFGLYLPLGENYELYIQARFINMLATRSVTVNLGSSYGLGIPLFGLGMSVDF